MFKQVKLRQTIRLVKTCAALPLFVSVLDFSAQPVNMLDTVQQTKNKLHLGCNSACGSYPGTPYLRFRKQVFFLRLEAFPKITRFWKNAQWILMSWKLGSAYLQRFGHGFYATSPAAPIRWRETISLGSAGYGPPAGPVAVGCWGVHWSRAIAIGNRPLWHEETVAVVSGRGKNWKLLEIDGQN